MKRSPAALAAAAAVFLVNGVILGVELLATRLLFPQYGNTVFTWSTIICIIIAGLFAGYMAGGVASDRSRDRLRLMAAELFLAGIAVVWIPALRDALMPGASGAPTPPFWACFLAFGLPAALLASAPPAAVGILTDEGLSPSLASGLVSALSAAGSIAGTLLTTFWLIPQFGVRTLFLLMGALLALSALPLAALGKRGSSRALAAVWLAAFGAGASLSSAHPASPLADSQLVFSKDSAYQLVRVLENPGRKARVLMLDSTWEGAMRTDTREAMFDYTRAYMIFPNLLSAQKEGRALFIGGGAYVMPARVAEILPRLAVEVAEIDPVVERVGREFFDSGRAANLKTLVADGRRALAGSRGAYDGIFIDAYHGVMAIPFHLVTREFFESVRTALTADGFLALNLIGELKEREGFFCAALATLRSVFPEVKVYPVQGAEASGAQNLIITASAKPLSDRALWGTGFEQGFSPESLACRPSPALTDDHAPVEWLVARYLR